MTADDPSGHWVPKTFLGCWMLKTLMKGFVFGIGFAVAWIVIMTVYAELIVPTFVGEPELTIDDLYGRAEQQVLDSPPEIVDGSSKFRGTPGMYPTEYSWGRAPVLAEGPAKIIGSVDADGEPIQGLRLRLILNDTTNSHWAVSGYDGQYVLNVPPGDYQVTGFELDRNTADQVLAGFVDGPNFDGPFGDVIAVTEDSSGTGLRFSYVSPVVKSVYREAFSLDDEIVLTWEPYTDAVEYKIQIEGRDKNNSPREIDTLFKWDQHPRTRETQFDLTPLAKLLKAGYYYTYEVTALDTDGNWLSKSDKRWGDYDFRVE